MQSHPSTNYIYSILTRMPQSGAGRILIQGRVHIPCDIVSRSRLAFLAQCVKEGGSQIHVDLSDNHTRLKGNLELGPPVTETSAQAFEIFQPLIESLMPS